MPDHEQIDLDITHPACRECASVPIKAIIGADEFIVADDPCQLESGRDAVGLVEFWRIDVCKAQSGSAASNAVAVRNNALLQIEGLGIGTIQAGQQASGDPDFRFA